MSLRYSALILCLLLACRLDRPAAPITVPATGSIDSIEVSPANLVLTDTAVIEAVRSFVEAHNTDWYHSWRAVPSPDCTFTFWSNSDFTLTVWVGPDWLGVRMAGDGPVDRRLRRLERQDRSALLGLLGDRGCRFSRGRAA